MLKFIKKIYGISGENRKRFNQSILYQLFECMLASMPYGVLLFILFDICEEKLNIYRIAIYSAILAVTLVFQMFCNYKVNKIQSSIGYDIVKQKRMDIGSHLRKLSMGYFTNEKEGNLISSVTNDLSFIEFNCMNIISKLINSAFSSVIALVIMILVDYRLGLVAVILFPIAYIFYKKSVKKFDAEGDKKFECQNKMIMSILEYVGGLSTLRVFNKSGKVFKILQNNILKFRKSAVKYEVEGIGNIVLYKIFVNLGSGLILLFGSLMVINSQIELYEFMLFIVVSIRFYQPIEIISSYYGLVKLMDISFDNVEKIMSEKTLLETNVEKKIKSYDIKFKNVDFSYDKEATLKNINAFIKQNEVTALIGPSGSGKSTMANLIARFHDIDKGSISIGGIDIRDLKYETLMSYISVVFQDVYLFNDTVYNNIIFGTKNITKEKVILACKKANCHQFIENLDNGYDTVIGEGGNTLSGGEKQRISIARAILKDAPIILLDEATASVDPENEVHLQRAINELTKGKTLIIIAHKLSHIKDANNIIVLNKGEIVESGAHSQLIELKGRYYDFYKRRSNVNGWKIAR